MFMHANNILIAVLLNTLKIIVLANFCVIIVVPGNTMSLPSATSSISVPTWEHSPKRQGDCVGDLESIKVTEILHRGSTSTVCLCSCGDNARSSALFSQIVGPYSCIRKAPQLQNSPVHTPSTTTSTNDTGSNFEDNEFQSYSQCDNSAATSNALHVASAGDGNGDSLKCNCYLVDETTEKVHLPHCDYINKYSSKLFDIMGVANVIPVAPLRLVAKIVHKDCLLTGPLLRSARFEVETVRHLSHPNILPLSLAGETEDELWMLFELSEWGDLHSYARFRSFVEEEVWLICYQLLHALAHIHHKGIVHCDIKPQNVLLFSKNVDTRHDVLSNSVAFNDVDNSVKFQLMSYSINIDYEKVSGIDCIMEDSSDAVEYSDGLSTLVYCCDNTSDTPMALCYTEEVPLRENSVIDSQCAPITCNDALNGGSLNSQYIDDNLSVSEFEGTKEINKDLMATMRPSMPPLKEFVLKLCDFGISQRFNEERSIQWNGVRGSHGYIAPEMLQELNYDDKVDMWALGIIVFELIGGYPPFFPASSCVQEIVTFDLRYWSSVSKTCVDFIERLLCSDSSKRMSAAEALDHPWMRQVHFLH